MANSKKCYFLATPDEIIERCLLFLPRPTNDKQQARRAGLLRVCKRVYQIYLPLFWSHLYLTKKTGELKQALAQHGASVRSIKMHSVAIPLDISPLCRIFRLCPNVEEVDIALREFVGTPVVKYVRFLL